MAGRGNTGGRYRPAQARPTTLEELRQYVWQELQQIGGALDSATESGIAACQDIIDGVMVDGDVLDYKPDLQAWCTGRRTRFLVEGYIQGRAYQRGDEVANGSQISECLVDGATESPYISPVGEQIQGYAGTLSDTSPNVKTVIFGQRYSFFVSGYLNAVRIYTHAGMAYQVHLVTNPTGTPKFTIIEEFTATETAWVDVDAGTPIVNAGSVIDIIVVVEKPADVPIIETRNYNYTTPQNNIAPVAGGILHPNENRAVMNVSYTDSDGADAIALIQAIEIGDRIATTTQEWVVSSITDFPAYTAFGITPATQDITDGVKAFQFRTVVPAPITYSFETDYYNPQPFPNVTINGLLAIDGGYENVVVDQSAYGIDLKVQAAYVPTQWWVKVMATGALGGGGGGGVIATRPTVIFTPLTTYNVTLGDENALICTTSDTPVAFVLPNGGLPAGFITHVHQYGLGQVTVSAVSPSVCVSSRSLLTRAQHSALSVFNLGNGSYSVVGDQE